MTCRFAPVAPIRVLNSLAEKKCLGSYHLVLAHDVAENLVDFHKLFSNRDAINPRTATVIIDNSIIELGESVPASLMRSAVEAFTFIPNVVTVLPEVLMDSEGTTKAALKGIEAYQGIDKPLLFIPQGKTLSEFMKCAESLRNEKIEWIGIPRNMTKVTGSRRDLIPLIRGIYPNAKIHLFGFSDDLYDDILSARDPFVSGIDSAVLTRMGDAGMELTLAENKHPERGDYWKTAAEANDTTAYNIKYFNQLIGNSAIQ